MNYRAVVNYTVATLLLGGAVGALLLRDGPAFTLNGPPVAEAPAGSDPLTNSERSTLTNAETGIKEALKRSRAVSQTGEWRSEAEREAAFQEAKASTELPLSSAYGLRPMDGIRTTEAKVTLWIFPGIDDPHSHMSVRSTEEHLLATRTGEAWMPSLRIPGREEVVDASLLDAAGNAVVSEAVDPPLYRGPVIRVRITVA